MRVFIFNNGMLKAVTSTRLILVGNKVKKIDKQKKEVEIDVKTLADLIDFRAVGGPGSNEVKKKKNCFAVGNNDDSPDEWANYWVDGLWATLERNLESITLGDSKEKIRVYDDNIEGKGTAGNPLIDIYLDRGTGWVAFAQNYNVALEINNDGAIKEKSKLFEGKGLKVLPWHDYSKCWLKVIKTSGTNNFTEALKKGQISTVPAGCGNFYGKPYKLDRDMFEGLNRLTERLSLTVKCLIEYEWPAFIIALAGEALQQPQQQQPQQQNFNKDLTITNWSTDITKKTLANYFIKNERIENRTREVLLATKQIKHAKNDVESILLSKIRTIGHELAMAHRQLRFTLNSTHFDDTGLDLKWYQLLASSAVTILIKLLKSAKLVELAVSGGVDPGVASAVTNAIASQLEKVQQSYLNGGQDKPIREAIHTIYQTLTLTYATYLNFLMTWGIQDRVIGSSKENTERKINKLIEIQSEQPITSAEQRVLYDLQKGYFEQEKKGEAEENPNLQ